MKKHTKRLLSLVAVVAMSCSMMTAWANTAAITKVEVWNTDGSQLLREIENPADNANFEVNPSNLVKVTVKISDGETAVGGAEATFLSYLSGAEGNLSDANIQFIDQQTTSSTEGDTLGTVTFAFRPRTTESFPMGAFTAKAGGEAVTTAASTTYTVKAADVQLTLTGGDTIDSDSTADMSFTVGVAGTGALPAADALIVKIDGEVLTKGTDYTYDGAGALVISNEALIKDVGTHTVAVSAASGYVAATASYVVNEYIPDVEITEGDEDAVAEGVSDAADAIVNATPEVNETNETVSIACNPVTINGASTQYEVRYSVAGDNVTLADNKITWDYGESEMFAQRATLTVSVGSEVETTDIYFIRPGETVSFGNATIIANDNECAFSSQENLKAAVANSENNDAFLELRAKVLNIVFNGVEAESVASWKDTLDLNGDEEVALSEYYIIKRMIEDCDVEGTAYTVESVKANKK